MLRDRDVQYGLKFFFAISMATVGIILVTWKWKGSQPEAVESAFSMASFYFNWEPGRFQPLQVALSRSCLLVPSWRAAKMTRKVLLGTLISG